MKQIIEADFTVPDKRQNANGKVVKQSFPLAFCLSE
jgi:hypothetical protein